MDITQPNNERLYPPDLAEFISRRMRDISSRINCMLIGKVVSFNANFQTVDVEVQLTRVIKNVGASTDTVEPKNTIKTYPRLVSVPVVFLQGGVSYLTFPIAAGDTCIVLFFDRDIDIWLNENQVAPPNSERLHDLKDAVAIVGIRNFLNPLPNYNTEIASLVDKTGERLAQAGDLKVTARSAAPSGWLLCYGQAISRTTYSILFAAIGTTYGAGDGSTTFNVPDLRGRVPVGLDNMGGSNANVLTNTYNPNRNTLGGAIGEESHQLTIPEMPAHHHTYTYVVAPGAGDSGGALDTYSTTNTGDTGNDVPHQNVQPGRMFNWVIKI